MRWFEMAYQDEKGFFYLSADEIKIVISALKEKEDRYEFRAEIPAINGNLLLTFENSER